MSINSYSYFSSISNRNKSVHLGPFESGHKYVSFILRALAIALRSLYALISPLIVLLMAERQTPTRRAISAPVTSLSIIAFLIFFPVSLAMVTISISNNIRQVNKKCEYKEHCNFDGNFDYVYFI